MEKSGACPGVNVHDGMAEMACAPYTAGLKTPNRSFAGPRLWHRASAVTGGHQHHHSALAIMNTSFFQ